MRTRRTPALAVVMAVLVAVPVPAASSASAGVHVRVATYNIRAGSGEDGVFDLARTAGEIRSLNADVVGLQEVDVHWGERSRFTDEAANLAGRLGMLAFFAPIYDLDPPVPGAPRRRFGVAVLSRLPRTGAENHEITRLSTQDSNPVPKYEPGFAEVTVDVRGARIHVYCTHLDYRPDPAVRAAQVRDMRHVLNREDRGVGADVVVGDFNAEASAPELAPLWQRLRDAGPGGNTYPAGAPARRIDLIAVSPRIAALGARRAISTASDHLPVVADLELNPS